MSNLRKYNAKDGVIYPSPYFNLEVFKISDKDKEELNKRVLNYLSEGTEAVLTQEEREQLSAHITFLNNTYFSNGEGAIESSNMNNVTFSLEKWNVFSSNINKIQSYSKDDLIKEVNNFVEDFNNFIEMIAQQTINNYLNKSLNEVYKNNQFEDGDPILEPLDIDNFEIEYKNKYSIYEENFKNNVNRVIVSKEQPILKKVTWIKIKG